MKTFLLTLLTGVAATAALAQYSIDWYKVSGGGGTSTSGVYSVSGTIGQPDAGGPMTGGNYSLTGGFWALYAVQTPGAPLLTITTAGNLITVWWPRTAESWRLERTNTVAGASAPWPPVPPPYQTNADTVSVTFTNGLPVGNQFYRLHKP
jgi:hypothetical protein